MTDRRKRGAPVGSMSSPRPRQRFRPCNFVHWTQLLYMVCSCSSARKCCSVVHWGTPPLLGDPPYTARPPPCTVGPTSPTPRVLPLCPYTARSPPYTAKSPPLHRGTHPPCEIPPPLQRGIPPPLYRGIPPPPTPRDPPPSCTAGSSPPSI